MASDQERFALREKIYKDKLDLFTRIDAYIDLEREAVNEANAKLYMLENLTGSFLLSLLPNLASIFGDAVEDGKTGDGAAGGGGYAGAMPTAANYNGPTNGAHGQKNLKGRIEGTDKWNDLLLKVSVQKGMNPVFMKIIMAIESAGDPHTNDSDAGAVGIMQVLQNWKGYDYKKVRTDPEYAIAMACDIVKTKAEDAKRSKDPQNVHEVAWRYYGKTSGGKSYGDQAVQMYTGLGFNKSDTVFINPVQSAGSGGDTNISIGKNFKMPSVELVSIKGGQVIIPKGDRSGYQRARFEAAKASNYAGFVKVGSPWTFANPDQNQMAPDFAAVMALIAPTIMKATGRKGVTVSSGRRIWDPNVANAQKKGVRDPRAHGSGHAIDIQCKGVKDALKVADACWSHGLRAVQIGGSLGSGGGFVHVDCGVASGWDYGYGTYSGPTSLKKYR